MSQDREVERAIAAQCVEVRKPYVLQTDEDVQKHGGMFSDGGKIGYVVLLPKEED